MAFRLVTHVCLFMLCLVPSYSGALDLDFNNNIVCELEYFQMCEHGKRSCRWGDVVDVDGKQTLMIDVKENMITLFENGNQLDRERISSISSINETLYLHGTNPDSRLSKNGTGWVARINKEEGALSAASLADAMGYLIFGACRNQ